MGVFFLKSYKENIQNERTSSHRNPVGLFMDRDTRILFIIFLELLNILLVQKGSVLKCLSIMFREERCVVCFLLMTTWITSLVWIKISWENARIYEQVQRFRNELAKAVPFICAWTRLKFCTYLKCTFCNYSKEEILHKEVYNHSNLINFRTRSETKINLSTKNKHSVPHCASISVVNAMIKIKSGNYC